MSRLSIAYIFWALGGLFGLHHIYLGRVTHAIFFNMTFAFCGLGWIYDFFHIPQYVKQANSDPIYLGLLRKKIKERPPASVPRALSLYAAAYFFSHLSLAVLGPFEPIEARIGGNLETLPISWIIATNFVQTVGILLGCLLINSIGGQRTVSRWYLYLPILIGTLGDIILAYVAGARMLIMCRALFPTLFYLRSCEWLPTCANPKPRYFTSLGRFLRLFLQYLLATSACVILIIGSLYFYCDVFVAQDGSIEYSDANYGIGFDQTTFLSQFSWDMPSFKPEVVTLSTATATNSTIQSQVETTSGKQPQYSYPQFQAELTEFYHDYLESTQKSTQSNSQSPLETSLDHLSMPYSYRFRDLFRNIYFSSILQPVHSAINYYNVDYIPGFDPLFPPLSQTDNYSTLPISTILITLSKQLFSKSAFIFRCVYYFAINSYNFATTHGLSKFIIELDIKGLSWAQAYLTYLNQGKSLNCSQPLSPKALGEIKSLAISFLIQRLTPVQGDVSKLPYWSQRAIYDTIVAYGRLHPQ